MIRTPDQRVRVFVSSALGELAAERHAVRDAVTRLRLVPVLFELGARPYPPRPVYRAYLAQSQVFVGIYWQSYGWVAPGEEISGLEDEYELSAGLPRLIYVKSPAPDREPRLEQLLARIQDEGGVSYQYFSDPGELRQLVENDLAVLLSERFEMAQPHTAAESPGRTDQRVRTGSMTAASRPRSRSSGTTAELRNPTGSCVRELSPASPRHAWLAMLGRAPSRAHTPPVRARPYPAPGIRRVRAPGPAVAVPAPVFPGHVNIRCTLPPSPRSPLASPEARPDGSAQRISRFEHRPQPAPPPGSTWPRSRASLAGNRAGLSRQRHRHIRRASAVYQQVALSVTASE
jgi:Domain of unknown function (DUF4062)